MSNTSVPTGSNKTVYNRFLLLVAGLGGLLYGVDVGIIAGALPYLQDTSNLPADKLSFIVAAVLLGGVFSTLFAGLLADWMGRKPLMILSGVLFVASIPMIAMANGFMPLMLGRLLQGVSGGLIGVVVPLYLAECLDASNRGKGTGIFQWLLTLGIVAAAFVGMYFSYKVEQVAALKDAAKLFAYKDTAWRSIFWVSLPPGILFVIGAFLIAESPRWLFGRGKKEAARTALLRSRSDEQANLELEEMEKILANEKAQAKAGKAKESLLRRKYILPFVLACIILACNQATGVNSIIGYTPTILYQAGLSDFASHWGYVILTVVNFAITYCGVLLVDRKGRKFLLALGSAGVIIALLCAGLLFLKTEKMRVDCKDAAQSMVTSNQTLKIQFNQEMACKLLAGKTASLDTNKPLNLIVIYSYGGFRAATKVFRSNDELAKPVDITRESCVKTNKVEAFFSSPLANVDEAVKAPLKIDNALISPVPDSQNGMLVAICLYIFMAFFAVGPGVCVWLALSELMPTRIRSNGMSIALLINQAVSATIAGVFLPVVGEYGYSTMFFCWAGCTVIYFITATFFLPETKGKTLEQIEEHFEGKKSKA